ncbi:MAG: spore coat U domain-containing protein [Comamonadaceae bacterium]|nr:MAG: spore coat U domain-containing protein [Comamonadaceae bacterium]
MVSAQGQRVAYQLFRDPARTQVWGAAAQGLAVAGTGTGLAQAYTVYGRVPAQATPAPGIYSDRIVVTVTY